MTSELRARGWPLRTWLAYWRAKGRYHRFTTHGLEHLDQGPALIVGYHGRPVAYDLCMLSVTLYDRLGTLPHAVFHGSFEAPGLRWWLDRLGCVTGDDPRLAPALGRGEHLIVLPGGTREAHRSFLHRHEVDWGERLGYLRLALKHRLPLVPVAAWGTDDSYLGLVDGHRLARRLHLPAQIPLWAGLGPLGPWPFSPPFPVRMTQVIGAPIRDTATGDLDPDDREALLALHRRVTGGMQGLFDEARRRQRAPRAATRG